MSEYAWAIAHWRVGLYVETVRRTRNEAIAAFKDLYGFDHVSWEKDRRFSIHKPIRVCVTPCSTALSQNRGTQ